ncbi:uncharacterized protein [Venturia canescens]|uniref:uncharacterized protein isoform X1 n=1 Tax=Venturia canescens TaxID=32260 RepID=UPI001C9C13E7|nr:uncharacterized protein LOC122414963 isoform X1 [Venturia canescens]
MNKNEKISVTLQDAETGKQYTIFVTKDESQRINTDLNFASLKLQEAIAMHYDLDAVENDYQENMEILDESGHDQSTPACAEFGVFKWPHDAILLLIEEYRSQEDNFKSGKTSQKKIWAAIAEKMKKYGHSVTGPQCLSKRIGLKRTYEDTPVTTLSSSTKRTRSPSECSNSSL